MTRNELLLHIEELVNRLDEQQQRLQSFSGEIPALETDLLQRLVRQLYEHTLELDKRRSEGPSVPEPAAEGIKTEQEATPVQPAAKTEQEVPPPVKEPVHESTAEQITVEAGARNVTADALPVAGIRTKKIKGDVNTVLFKDGPTIGDRFEDELTLHEKIASVQPSRTVASHQQRKPITDLKKAIGLNEKFLFINPLFDGNLQVYNQAIDYLDASPSKVAAKEYIQNTLVPQFAWEQQSKPCQLFMELVERRFSF